MPSRLLLLSLITAFGLAVLAPPVVLAQDEDPISGPNVIEPLFVGETKPLKDLAAAFAAAPDQLLGTRPAGDRQVPNMDVDLRELRGPAALARTLMADPAAPVGGDPARQIEDGMKGTTPQPRLSFEGTDDDDNAAVAGVRLVPPDTEGDIGRKYYVQMNNVVFEIFDKRDGTSVLGPLPNNIFFAGTGTACELTNDGDPIVLYDHHRRRWILSQFALPIFSGGVPDVDGHQCFAVSKTSDPLGAYYIYDYVTALPEFGGFFAINDYPKLGVWRDGYYYTANDFECLPIPDQPGFCGFSFTNVSAIAFDKRAMLRGKPAKAIQFKIGPIGATDEIVIGVQPSHWEGRIPPRWREPNTFWQTFDSEEFTFSESTGPDGILSWDFHANFRHPMKSRLVANELIEFPEYESFVCSGAGRNCIDQPTPGTVAEGNGLDTIDFRTMFRAQYRNFGRYSAVVLSVSADADGDSDNGVVEAGIRWAEVRKGSSWYCPRHKTRHRGWRLHQAGTFAPLDGEQRFMPSIAQNREGDIALGYTVSSTQTHPSVRYTTRRRWDPRGVMTGGEVSCFEGTGAQIDSFNRWGDYSAMSVDPSDGCTFWYTNEYYEDDAAFDFKTRICKIDTCIDWCYKHHRRMSGCKHKH